MKIFYAIFFLVSFYSYSNENLYKVSLTEKTAYSSYIVEGKVSDRQSFWNSSHTMIYTKNTIQLFSVFKGSLQGQTVTVITEGGRVGNESVSTSSLLELNENSYGMFFLIADPTFPSYYRVFSERQGFIVYSQDERVAVCPFYETSCDLHRDAVLKLLGKKKSKLYINKPITEPTKSLNILSFSPQTVTAGTQTVLTINGTDFGTGGPSANAYVQFTDANNGQAATYYAADLLDYISWTNTQIQVQVPSRAGTGLFQVVINGVVSSSVTPLTVNYSLINASNHYRLRLINDDAIGGSTWKYSTNTTTTQRSAFIRAMDTWKCTSGIAWTMGASTTVTSAINGDGINLFAMSSSLAAGVLGVCYNYMSSCNGNDWHLFEQDILFRSNGTIWNYTTAQPTSSELDFESVAFHELGHAHLLGHVNDGNDVMYFSIGSGVAKRTPTPYNVIAANHIMSFSTTGPLCSQPVMVANFPLGCNPSSTTDVQVTGSTLNPSAIVCFGAKNFYASLNNVANQTISSVEFQWSVNNVMQTPFTWTGNLQGGQSLSNILVGSSVINSINNTVKIWADQVNGNQELITNNDTLTFNLQADPCTNNNSGILAIQSPNNTVCPGVTDNVFVTLKNYGINPLTSCKIYLSKNGTIMDSVNWTGNIAPGQSLSNVYAGNLAFYNGTYTVSARTALPNGVTDTWPANDSTIISYVPKFCPHNDIGITSMNQLNPALCPENLPFTVCMTNFGIDVITNCTIHLTVNGTELITFPWIGTLLPDSTVLCNINLGSVTLDNPQNTIHVFTSSPNFNTDERPLNDLVQQLYSPLHLAGTYTIGGTNPDFSTIVSAANYVNTYGICDDVTFNIRSGSYQELFVLNNIPSFNGEHTVTFQSEAGNADSVILNRYFFGGWAYNTLLIDSTSNLVLRNLTFINSPVANGYPGLATTIGIKGPVKNIRFEGNKIYNSSVNVASTLYGVDIQTGSSNPNVGKVVFENNYFQGGTHAVLCSPSSDFFNHLAFSNNLFKGQLSYCLNIEQASNVCITNNQFKKTTGYYGALQLENITDTLRVINNEIFQSTTGSVMTIYNTSGTSTNHSLFANNEINHQAFDNLWGEFNSIDIRECGYLDFVHNTIRQTNLTSASPSFIYDFGTGTTNLLLLNNLAQCTGNAYIYRFANTPGTLNYNDFKHDAGYFALVNGNPLATLAAFQTAQSKDLNSFSINPGFVGTSLYPYNAALDNLGTPFSAVLTDRLGNVRSVTTPDVGAYEFTKFNWDIGISDITSESAACGDSLELVVSVSNYGIQNVSNFEVQVQINDSVYAVQSITQNISSDATLSGLNLGTFSIVGGQLNTIKVLTLLPNGFTDQFELNDSLANSEFAAPLNGFYTVGGTGSDFSTITAAVNFLNEYGVCGPTVLNIVPGIYLGKYELNSVQGLSEVNTLLIQSANQDSMSVTLQHTYYYLDQPQSRYIFHLRNLNHVTVRYLKFMPFGGQLGGSNGNYDEAVQFTEVSYVTLSNCHFVNGDIRNDYTNDLNGDARTHYHVTIRNNYFADGDIILIDGDTVAVENNYFSIGSMNIYRGRTIRLEGNLFIGGNQSAPSTIKFNLSSGIQILRNNFRSSTLHVESCQPLTTGVAEEALIANNFFGTTLIGLFNSGIHLVNNSFNVPNWYSFTIYGPWASVRNNIFHTPAYPPYAFDNYSDYTSTTYSRNAIYSNSPNMAAVVGGQSNPILISRQQWIAGGKDVNSIYDVNPNYYNTGTNDLHINSPVFDGAGILIPYITNDIDGESRSASSIDLGADEFVIDSSQFYDLALYRIISPDPTICSPVDSLRLRIINHANFAIDSFKVETLSYDYSYGLQSFTVHIPANDTIDLTTQAFNFIPFTGYQLKFILSDPNGQIDDITSNDSKTVNYTTLDSITIYEREDPYCGAHELLIDEFPITSILWSTGATSDRITVTTPGTYSVTVTVPGGCQVTGTIQIN